tara:strand:- start:12319 stop:23472 length:11154 start_codon:yes stop_codon:yes gene_type:complete
MSLKDLFKEHNYKYLGNSSINSLTASGIESAQFVEKFLEEKDKFVPLVDYSKPENFARFGSAEKYYYDSIKRTYETYPYDGSKKEKILWELSSSNLDLYLFENGYPRTTGYANFLVAASTSGNEGFFYPPVSNEYILVKGGPHPGSGKSIYVDPDTGEAHFRKDANLYDISNNRENNLLIDGTKGNTVEFWLKKDAYVADQEYFEFIVDAHVTGTTRTSADYGRLSIALASTGTVNNTSNQAFFISYASGSTNNIRLYMGAPTLTTASIADGNWHHYAVRMRTQGAKTFFDLFVDGKHNDSATGGFPVGYVSGSIIANVGAQVATFYDGTSDRGERGWSPFSGSIDEFRYWKRWRTSKQIQTRWFDQVGGGTNTDLSNTDLGVYFKFNEGILGKSATDSKVLDYSGRVSNGTWVGYSSAGSRETGSAINESGLTTYTATEFKDPILYSSHPEVFSFMQEKRKEGKEYDYRNPSTIYYSLPSWILEEHETSTPDDDGIIANSLWNLTQIISSYFDNVANMMSSMPALSQTSYFSASFKPTPFMSRILESKGFIAPEIFNAIEALEYFESRDDDTFYTEKISNVKNLIYKNIYNNLTYINKTKGTEKSFRNLIRCFGIDDEIYKLNYYSNNVDFTLEDNYRLVSDKFKLANFNTNANSDASVYQFSSSLNTNTRTFISASKNFTVSDSRENSLPLSVEASIVFPLRVDESKYNTLATKANSYRNNYPLVTTASLFGMHTARDFEPEDTTWDSNDYANFLVKAIKPSLFSNKAKFELTGTAGGFIPKLTSSYYDDVYNDTPWNFLVCLYPEKYPNANQVLGTTNSDYVVEFSGIQKTSDITLNQFTVTGSMTAAQAVKFLASPKRTFVGAHRTNFTGSLLEKSDIRVNSFRVWQNKLTLEDLSVHASDPSNYSIKNPEQNAYLFNESVNNIFVPNKETLLLHWNFDTVTGSNASGQFIVEDLTSGSINQKPRYGYLENIVNKQYTGVGFQFANNSTSVVSSREYAISKPNMPETLTNENTVKVLTNDDRFYNRDTRPIFFDLYVEKSPYQNISEEMLKFMSTTVSYNNLIGRPVDRYRSEYKSLNTLRQLFFERMDAPNIDKYIEYFKWFDLAVSAMIQKLAPMSSGLDERPLRNIIESHILERNKYESKFPTYEFKQSDPEGSLFGINELTYPWKEGHAPLDPLVSPIAATAVIVAGEGGTIAPGQTFTLTNAAGVITTYTANGGGSGTGTDDYRTQPGGAAGSNINVFFKDVGGGPASKDKVAEAVEKAINATTNGDYTAVRVDSTITVTQNTAGAAGNRSSTNSSTGTGLTSVGDFTGGRDVNTDDSCLWWKERAERALSTSGVAGVDSDRQEIINVINNQTNATPPNLSSSAGTYQGSTYALRRFPRPYKINAVKQPQIHGGGNAHENKKVGFWDSIRKRPSPSATDEGGLISIEPPETKLESFKDCDDNLALNKGKRKYKFSAFATIDGNNPDTSNVFKGDHIFPFSLYSSSVDSNPAYADLANFQANLAITNLHHDNYGPFNDVPMQGPFTEKYVGGRAYRHVMTNFTPDNEQPEGEGERLEGWRLTASADLIDLVNVSPHNPKSVYFREEYAKRPVNIKNIQQTTGALEIDSETSFAQGTDAAGVTKIGNYTNTYEIVMTNGRSINNRYLAESEGDLASITAASMTVSGVIDFELPRRDLTGSNKAIIVNRFSAPGDPATMAEGVLDAPAGELSVYNALPYRNLAVRDPLNELHSDHTNQFGLFSDAKTVADFEIAGEEYPGGNSSIDLDRSATIGKATALIVAGEGGSLSTGKVFTLTDADNVKTTYRVSAAGAFGTQAGGPAGTTFDVFFGGVGGGPASKDKVAEAVEKAINATTNAGYTAVRVDNKITVTQNTGGTGGNRQNSDNGTGLASVSDFTGGFTDAYPFTGSFHKVNRNTRLQPFIGEDQLDQSFTNTKIVTFNGTSDRVNIGTAATWNNLIGNGEGSVQRYTLSAWINASSLNHAGGGNESRIFDFGDGDITLFITNTGELRLTHKYTKRNGQFKTAAGLIETNRWYHIAVTHDSSIFVKIDAPAGDLHVFSNPKFYINGELVATSVVVPFPSDPPGTSTVPSGKNAGINTEACFIGDNNTGDRNFQGVMDEISVWGDTLTGAQVGEIYNGSARYIYRGGPGDLSKHTAVDELISWWRADGSSGTTLTDSQGSNNGTIAASGKIINNDGSTVEILNPVIRYTEQTKRSYDNFFVQHQIPQTDVQYAWISSSLINDYTGPALYDFEQPNFSNASLASTDLTFVSRSDFGVMRYFGVSSRWGRTYSASIHNPDTTDWIPVDFAGLNTVIYEDTLTSDNSNLLPAALMDRNNVTGGIFNSHFASSDGFITVDVDPSTAVSLNALLLHRQGPYGGSNWKLCRQDNHPVARALREENRLSFLEISQVTDVDANTNTIESINSAIEPPITSKYKQLSHIVTYSVGPLSDDSPAELVQIDHSYMNNIRFFTDHEADNIDLDDKLLSQRNIKEERQTLDVINHYILGGGLNVHPLVNPIKGLESYITRETIFPREQYTYLSFMRQRENYQNGFWRDSRAERTNRGVNNTPRITVASRFDAHSPFIGDFNTLYAQVKTDGTPHANGSSLTASIWPLDARDDFVNNSPGRIKFETEEGQDDAGGLFTVFPPVSASNDVAGILQNNVYPYSVYTALSGGLLAHDNSSFSGPNWFTQLGAPESPPPDFQYVAGLHLLPQYNRRVAGIIPTDSDHEYKFGDNKWEAGDQSGLAPFYDTYSEYIEDIKRIGKDHGLLPEFRISEHMEYYINEAPEGFLTKPIGGKLGSKGFLEITGAALQDSSVADFASTYSHSDFLKTFSIVSDFYGDTSKPSRITLSADALIKLLPYDGFYPADRSVQLTKLFYDNYSASFSINGNLVADLDQTNQVAGKIAIGEDIPKVVAGAMNPVWKSLFAPGILYNSIKSGIAVDYPVHTLEAEPVTFTGSPNQRISASYLIDIPRITKGFDFRVPFEALLDPESAFGNKFILDNEPHPSASLNLTASISNAGKPNYKLAMNNFLASTIDFFLPNGEMSSITSQFSDTDGLFNSFEDPDTGDIGFQVGKEYRMRLACFNGKIQTKKEFLNIFNDMIINNSDPERFFYSASYDVNPPSCVMYAQTGAIAGERNKVADYYGSSFGPPVRSFSLCRNNVTTRQAAYNSARRSYSSASYEPFTPPYHNGYAHIEYVFKPTDANDFADLPTIFENLTVSYERSMLGEAGLPCAPGSVAVPGRQISSTATENAMVMSASFARSVVKQLKVDFDQFGNPVAISNDPNAVGFLATFQPKWETPILNFRDADVTLATIGSASAARGMWHQYGVKPAEDEGIYFQIQALERSEKTDFAQTGSLALQLGLPTEKVKLGRVAPTKTISEAIVAIPFINDGANNIKRFTIESSFIDTAKEIVSKKNKGIDTTVESNTIPDNSIVDMVDKMQRFVIPPHLDFLTNTSITPFAMFIIEFSVDLTETDLSNIWQNLNPNISRGAQKKTASLPANVFSKKIVENGQPQEQSIAGLLEDFPENTRWMVFKVKQRSAANYFAKTASESDDNNFQFNFNFNDADQPHNYNWPYDFFSLIELAKIDANIENKLVVPTLGSFGKQANSETGVVENTVEPINAPISGEQFAFAAIDPAEAAAAQQTQSNLIDSETAGVVAGTQGGRANLQGAMTPTSTQASNIDTDQSAPTIPGTPSGPGNIYG